MMVVTSMSVVAVFVVVVGMAVKDCREGSDNSSDNDVMVMVVMVDRHDGGSDGSVCGDSGDGSVSSSFSEQ